MVWVFPVKALISLETFRIVPVALSLVWILVVKVPLIPSSDFLILLTLPTVAIADRPIFSMLELVRSTEAPAPSKVCRKEPMPPLALLTAAVNLSLSSSVALSLYSAMS